MERTHRLITTISWPQTSKLTVNAPFWAKALATVTGHLHIDLLSSLGMRLSVTPGRRTETHLAFAAGDVGEPTLRRLAGDLAGYDGIDGVRISFRSNTRLDEVDAFLSGGTRLLPKREGLHCPNGSNILMSLPLFPSIRHFCLLSQRTGVTMAYEFVAAPWQPTRDVVRAIRYNQVVLDEVPGLPGALRDDQRAITDRVQSSKMLADECLLIDASNPGGRAKHPLFRALQIQMQNCLYAQYGQIPEIEQPRSQRSLEFRKLTAPDPSTTSARQDLSDIAGGAVGSKEITEIFQLGWLPTWHAEQDQHAIDLALQQRATQSSGPVLSRRSRLFVSYARSNESTMLALVSALEQNGVACWVDRDIGAGSAWDAEIEKQISECSGVVAIVTREYQASQMCLKELRYAAQNNKTIVPLIEDGTTLGQGLRVLLSTTQQFRLTDPTVIGRIAALMRNQQTEWRRGARN